MLSALPKWWPIPALLLLVATVFAAGRFTAPARVETRTETKVVYQDRVVEKRVEVKVADAAAHRVLERVRYVYPDGTQAEHLSIHSDTEHHEASTATAARTEEKSLTQVHTETKVVETGGHLSLDVLVGIRPSEFSLLDLTKSIELGAVCQAKVLGPFSAGLWATTAPADPLHRLALGLAVGGAW